MSTTPSTRNSLFARTSRRDRSRVGDFLRQETVGGVLLLAGAVVALVWANSPWSGSYTAVSEFTLGPESLHLNLPLSQWAADGLLAIFFFTVGLELKSEFVAGDLRDPRRAALPIAAAFGGVLMPAVIYTLINLGDASALRGWAIPTATDIAFAVAVLAVIGRYLPSALRMFLLTLAVMDDLIAIVIIAVFYTDELSIVPLLLALVPLALFTLLVQRRVRSWWLLIPLAVTAWALVHSSGIHATVAGVLMGFAVPALKREGERTPLAQHFEHRWKPVSAGIAVPIFAVFAAGVAFGGFDGLVSALSDPVALGIMAGLLFGKTIGILGTTYLTSRFTKAELDDGVTWTDLLGISILAGIGFTVALLVGELSFGTSDDRGELVKIAVLCGSLLSALIATVLLRMRNRVYRRIREAGSSEGPRGGAAGLHDRDGHDAAIRTGEGTARHDDRRG